MPDVEELKLDSNQRAAIARAIKTVKLLDQISERVDKDLPDEPLRRSASKSFQGR